MAVGLLCTVLLVGVTDATSNALKVNDTQAVTAGRRLEVIKWPWKSNTARGGRSSGRGAGGRGSDSSKLGKAVRTFRRRRQANFNATRLPEGDRVCYPLAPNEKVKREGQIGDGTAFGEALQAIASKPEVKRVLEIGTWYGGGSTVNIARGVRDSWRATIARSLSDSSAAENCIERRSPDNPTMDERCCHSLVVTLEVFEPAWEHARRYLRDMPVWCVRGSTVRADEMLQVPSPSRANRPPPPLSWLPRCPPSSRWVVAPPFACSASPPPPTPPTTPPHCNFCRWSPTANISLSHLPPRRLRAFPCCCPTSSLPRSHSLPHSLSRSCVASPVPTSASLPRPRS